MVELVDTLDLKSNERKFVRVQVPSRVQNGRLSKDFLPFFVFNSIIFKDLEAAEYSTIYCKLRIDFSELYDFYS